MGLWTHMPHLYLQRRVVLNSNTNCQNPHPPTKILSTLAQNLTVLFLLGASLGPQINDLLQGCEVPYKLSKRHSIDVGLLAHMPMWNPQPIRGSEHKRYFSSSKPYIGKVCICLKFLIFLRSFMIRSQFKTCHM